MSCVTCDIIHGVLLHASVTVNMLECEVCYCGTLTAETCGKSRLWTKGLCLVPHAHHRDHGLGTVIRADPVWGRDTYLESRAMTHT